jgi:hypothetical protein
MRGRFSYANAVATLALFVALGGGAYATQAGKVGPRDIERDAIRARHLADDAVRGAAVRDGALRLRDLIAWQTRANSGEVSLAPGDCSGGNIGQPPGDVVRPRDLIIAATDRTFTSPSSAALGQFAYPSEPTVMNYAICNFGAATVELSGGLSRAFGIRR